jgi:hypothetical protein
MAHIVNLPPIRFINIDHAVGPNEANNPEDVSIVQAFLRYLIDRRKDITWTKRHLPVLAWPSNIVDPTLFEMIKDYKTFKTLNSTLQLQSDEVDRARSGRAEPNGRIVPYDERFPFGGIITRTILALNFEVRGSAHRLSWPGMSNVDSAIDVMCNLYPDVKRALSGLTVREDMDWRDLARKGIPWNQWLFKHKKDALHDDQEARKRPEKDRLTFMTADDEVFKLLHPYDDDLKKFLLGEGDMRTETLLESSPNPSTQGQPVTFTARVRFMATKEPVLQGSVTFDMHRGIDVHMISSMPNQKIAQGGWSLTQLGKRNIVNGIATLTTNLLPKGITRMTATFPGWGNILGSTSGDPGGPNVDPTGLGQEVQ